MKSLEEKMKELPPELREEVEDFIEFLLKKKKRKKAKTLKQDWAGGLKDLRDKYTSLELQKRALELRGD